MGIFILCLSEAENQTKGYKFWLKKKQKQLTKETFFQLFLGSLENVIFWTKELPAKNILARQKVSQEWLLKNWRSGKIRVGQRFGKFTRHLIIDIDKGSPHRHEFAVQKLKEIFDKRRIRLTVCWSSTTSRGLHLVAFFDEPFKTVRLAKLAHRLIERAGFLIQNGHLEIYPSLTSPLKAVRLPFQQGFTILDDDLEPIWSGSTTEEREEKLLFMSGPYCSVKRFINDRLPPPKANEPDRREPFDKEKYNIGKELYQNGLDGTINRHEAQIYVGYYLFFNGYGYGREQERAELIKRWISSKHNGYSKEIHHNPRKVEKEIDRQCNWKGKGGVQRCQHSYSIINAQRHEDTMSKIEIGLRRCIQKGTLRKKNGSVNSAAIYRASGVTRRIIRKYQNWIPDRIKELEFPVSCEVEVSISS